MNIKNEKNGSVMKISKRVKIITFHHILNVIRYVCRYKDNN